MTINTYRLLRLLGAFLFCFSIANHGWARPSTAPLAAADAPALDGLWKGQLKVPGGQLEVIFRFVKLTGGEYFATLDVPLQKVSRMAVKTEVKGDTVRLYAEEAATRFTGRVSADGKQMAGTWQSPGFKVPMTLTFSPLPAMNAKNVRLTPPYREEEATFSNLTVNTRLAGMLTIPAGPGPFPAVVLLSDAGPQDRDGTVGDFAPLGLLADYLTRRGVAVLRFDDRGTGKSGGTPAVTTADLVSDAQAGLNYLRTRPEIDLAHLGLVGHGEGGNVALLAAAQPLPPAFVVTLAAYGLPGRDIVVQQQATTLRTLGTENAQIEAATKRQQAMLEIIRQTTDNAQAQAIVANMLKQSNAAIDNATAQASAAEMTSPRYRYFLAFNPIEKLSAVTCPVLLLNGTSDLTINADANLNALKNGLSKNKGVTVKKLQGVNHLFQPDATKWPIINGQPQPNFSPEAEETIREWIVAQAKK
ncbi:alpha/beta hydrolase family protein [Hymenobacter properus]|uniref:Alpha/beta fold hydrolase n=1 Tax=Hymenobacter properus TaxID=2791026 RepID=A0A931BFA1_9BACT|nr:alpha/beta fold hydrolase [Hymenobacter properus]MBF9142835.1 alpha/beta fold hydrolase [Hymenobacter properus]MBR7721644.1 alpha/beta fold hydrolase [Microvirga sp. SRT04]